MRQITIFDKKFKLFIPYKNIHKAVNRIAKSLDNDYNAHKNPVFISILNGAFMFSGDLLKEINFPCNISFIKVSSYLNDESSGKIKELIGLNEDLKNKHVVILEDIIDTGLTINFIYERLQAMHPASLKIAALFLKEHTLKKEVKIDYLGMTVPSKFLIGYGLDYNGFGRNYRDLFIDIG